MAEKYLKEINDRLSRIEEMLQQMVGGVIPVRNLQKWTPEEEGELQRLYSEYTASEVAKILKRPLSGVTKKLHELGVKKGKSALSKEQESYLLENHKTSTSVQMASHLGIKKHRVEAFIKWAISQGLLERKYRNAKQN